MPCQGTVGNTIIQCGCQYSVMSGFLSIAGLSLSEQSHGIKLPNTVPFSLDLQLSEYSVRKAGLE